MRGLWMYNQDASLQDMAHKIRSLLDPQYAQRKTAEKEGTRT